MSRLGFGFRFVTTTRTSSTLTGELLHGHIVQLPLLNTTPGSTAIGGTGKSRSEVTAVSHQGLQGGVNLPRLQENTNGRCEGSAVSRAEIILARKPLTA
jgi:hypothetical protein